MSGLLTPLRLISLDRKPLAEARFSSLDSPFSDGKALKTIQSDFIDWIYYENKITVLANEALKVYAGPQVAKEKFQELCADAAGEKLDVETDKLEASYKKKIDTIKERLRREERELKEDETELSQRKMEELGTHAETVLSLFSGRRRKISSSLTKRRMTSNAKADVEESEEMIEKYKNDIEELVVEIKG